MDKCYKIIILLATFLYTTAVLVMIGFMAARLVELTDDIQDTTRATKQLYNDIYKTLDNIKLVCPEELIEKDGEPVKGKPKPNYIEDLPMYIVDYQIKEVGNHVYTIYI